MTCIAAVAQGGRVWMAADSAASNEYVSINMDDPKVFRIGELLIGVSGEQRINQVLRYGLFLIDRPDGTTACEDMEWLVCTLLPMMRECLRTAGALHCENGIEKIGNDVGLLAGYRGRLYRIQRDLDVIPIRGSYFAAGSALDVALGSLHATEHMGLEPQERVVMAVKAAAYHGRGVREPITVECVG